MGGSSFNPAVRSERFFSQAETALPREGCQRRPHASTRLRRIDRLGRSVNLRRSRRKCGITKNNGPCSARERGPLRSIDERLTARADYMQHGSQGSQHFAARLAAHFSFKRANRPFRGGQQGSQHGSQQGAGSQQTGAGSQQTGAGSQQTGAGSQQTGSGASQQTGSGAQQGSGASQQTGSASQQVGSGQQQSSVFFLWNRPASTFAAITTTASTRLACTNFAKRIAIPPTWSAQGHNSFPVGDKPAEGHLRRSRGRGSAVKNFLQMAFLAVFAAAPHWSRGPSSVKITTIPVRESARSSQPAPQGYHSHGRCQRAPAKIWVKPCPRSTEMPAMTAPSGPKKRLDSCHRSEPQKRTIPPQFRQESTSK